MAPKKDEEALRAAKLRVCRLKKWPNFAGLGFALDKAAEPPHYILNVDSNSPSAAAGLRIRDVILAVNKEDTTKVTFEKLKEIIKTAATKQDTLELFVIEKSKYDALKKEKIVFDRKYAQTLETPNTMPPDYNNFPKNTPRTCNIRLGPQEPSLGFELVTGERDLGAYVQDVAQRSPASQAQLRKSDRIIEVDDEFVDDKPYTQIVAKMRGAKANGGIKLYVMDTGTYKYYKANGMPLESTAAADDDDDGDQLANGGRAGGEEMRVNVYWDSLFFLQSMTMTMTKAMLRHLSSTVGHLKVHQTIFDYAASPKRILPNHSAWDLTMTKCNTIIRWKWYPDRIMNHRVSTFLSKEWDRRHRSIHADGLRTRARSFCI